MYRFWAIITLIVTSCDVMGQHLMEEPSINNGGPDCVLAITFDEGGQKDWSVYASNPVLYRSSPGTNGPVRAGAKAGTKGWIGTSTTPNNNKLEIPNRKTLDAWYSLTCLMWEWKDPSIYNAFVYLISKNGDDAPMYFYNTHNVHGASTYGSSGAWMESAASTTTLTGRWNHIATQMEFTGPTNFTATQFANGYLMTGAPDYHTGRAAPMRSTAGPVRIFGEVSTYGLVGKADDVRMYNAIIPLSRIREIVQYGKMP